MTLKISFVLLQCQKYLPITVILRKTAIALKSLTLIKNIAMYSKCNSKVILKLEIEKISTKIQASKNEAFYNMVSPVKALCHYRFNKVDGESFENRQLTGSDQLTICNNYTNWIHHI